MKKILNLITKFGFLYTLFFILVKLGLCKEIPNFLLIKKQNYYSKLSEEKQKKELGEYFKNFTGYSLNWNNPKTFAEKIQVLKFTDSTKEKALYSDKYEAAKLIAKKYPGRINIVEQLGVWDDAEKIDFSLLPQKFVLKCNHGSAMNIIVKDKSTLNIKKTIKKLNDWLKLDYAYVMGMYEKHYTYIKPLIITEKFIEEMDGNLHDYKIHCFNGVPKYIQFIGDRVPNSHQYYYAFYDANWNKTDIQTTERILYPDEYPKPVKFDEMMKLAAEMSTPFKYVRVDFYIINNELYFGELTFTPDSGFLIFKDEKINKEWGDLIKL